MLSSPFLCVYVILPSPSGIFGVGSGSGSGVGGTGGSGGSGGIGGSGGSGGVGGSGVSGISNGVASTIPSSGSTLESSPLNVPSPSPAG